MWGTRVVIPTKVREQILDEMHGTHPGIVRMKAIARGIVWWPKLNSELERKVKQCSVCQQYQHLPSRSPVHPWEYPSAPWERIHIDFAGPFERKMLLIIIDAYSKWLDVHVITSATSSATIDRLRQTFAIHRLPRVIVSDNGSAVTISEFQDFMSQNGIKHVKNSPYHPSTNGLAE